MEIETDKERNRAVKVAMYRVKDRDSVTPTYEKKMYYIETEELQRRAKMGLNRAREKRSKE